MERQQTLSTVRELTEQLESCLAALETEEMKSFMEMPRIHRSPYRGPAVSIPGIEAAIEAGRSLLADEAAPGRTAEDGGA